MFCANGGVYYFASLEYGESRDAHHPELCSQLGLFVYVDLAYFRMGDLSGYFIDEGGNRLAGAAPCRPEINEYRLIGLQDFGLKIVLRDRYCAHFIYLLPNKKHMTD